MARTRSQKRAAKKARQSVASLYSGFARSAEPVRREPPEDARVTVLEARCRHNAQSDAKKVAGEMWGDLAGRAIALAGGERAADLWDTFKALDAADETYFRRIIGRTRFAAVAKMEYLPDAFETRADEHPRRYLTEDEKDRAAVRNWMRWQGFLGTLSAIEHSAIVSAMRQRVMLSHAGELTGAGQAFINALVRLDSVSRAG